MGKGLSPLQVDILTYLLQFYDAADLPGNERYKANLLIWGVEWYPSKIWNVEEYTRTMAAAISRSVVRLEERGLVLRNNQMTGGTPDPQPAVDFWTREPIMATGRARKSAEQTPPARSTSLMLTEAGREVAKGITVNKNRSDIVNR